MVPASSEKPRLRFPPMREDQRIAGEHPREINAAVDRIGEPHDLGIEVETSTDRQHAAEQQRRVDRRKLAPPLAYAGAQIDEVKEPAVLLRHPLREIS